METLWLEYAWTLLILIGLEGLLSADNALVLAVIAKHLPEESEKKSYKLRNYYGVRFHDLLHFLPFLLLRTFGKYRR